MFSSLTYIHEGEVEQDTDAGRQHEEAKHTGEDAYSTATTLTAGGV